MQQQQQMPVPALQCKLPETMLLLLLLLLTCVARC
jgi:hypothetical protein